jgi:hypothetical protein
MDSQISARQRHSKHVTTQTTIGETMMEYINTWLHSNIKTNDEKLLNYTNEACININKQNFRYWAEENLHLLHQSPLHSQVTVWCGLNSFGILRP